MSKEIINNPVKAKDFVLPYCKKAKEEKGQADKVIKHMKGFSQLLEQQKNNGLVSEKVYRLLKSDTDALIRKWEKKPNVFC